MMSTFRRLTIDDHAAILALWQRAGLHSIRPEGRDSRSEFEKQFAGGQIAIGLEEDGRLIGWRSIPIIAAKGTVNSWCMQPKMSCAKRACI
jgi:hypothetical protein